MGSFSLSFFLTSVNICVDHFFVFIIFLIALFFIHKSLSYYEHKEKNKVKNPLEENPRYNGLVVKESLHLIVSLQYGLILNLGVV